MTRCSIWIGVERIDPRSVWLDGKAPLTPDSFRQPEPDPELVDIRREFMKKLTAEIERLVSEGYRNVRVVCGDQDDPVERSKCEGGWVNPAASRAATALHRRPRRSALGICPGMTLFPSITSPRLGCVSDAGLPSRPLGLVTACVRPAEMAKSGAR